MARGEISGVTPCLAAKSACNSCPKCIIIHVGGAARGKKVKLRLLHAWKCLNLKSCCLNLTSVNKRKNKALFVIHAWIS